MKRNHNFLERVTQFVSGKGFYLVLLLCVAAIGVSGYFLMRSILCPQRQPLGIPQGKPAPQRCAIGGAVCQALPAAPGDGRP